MHPLPKKQIKKKIRKKTRNAIRDIEMDGVRKNVLRSCTCMTFRSFLQNRAYPADERMVDNLLRNYR